MKPRSAYDFFLLPFERHPYVAIFIVALTLRLFLLAVGFVDYWGDAHHNLIMSKLTLENGFVYSDFKDRAVAWLPFYRYWGSLVLLVTGSYSLMVINIANTLIGAIVASVTAWVGTKLINTKTGLFIGLITVIMPYMMVFSYTSMPEMLGALLLLGWFYGLYKSNIWLIVICVALGALTREEITFLIGISVLPLFYFKNYKAVGYSIGGLVLGLSIWSWWAYLNSGHPLSWLLNRFESTTTSTAFYADTGNFWVEYLLTPLSSLVQAFPLLLLFLWIKRPDSESDSENKNWILLAGFLVLAHWIFIFIAQFKIIAYPDPRMFILTVPFAIIWFTHLLRRGYFKDFINKKVIFIFLAISLIQLVVPYYRQYSLQPRKEVGEWIKANVQGDELIWSDLAVSIVESERHPNLFISSDKLIPNEIKQTDREGDFIANAILSKKIHYITSYNAPFDYTQTLWPQIRDLQPFEWEGITFIPVFSYSPFQYSEAGVHNFLRAQFEAPLQTATIWKLYRN